jgi:sec-independent protein translocase protein TatB
VFSLSPIKILVIVAVALVLLGPDKLPEVAHKLGTAWRSLKRMQERIESEVREVVPDLPSASEITRIVRSPVNLLNQLADRVDEREAPAAADEADGESTVEDATEADVSEEPPPPQRDLSSAPADPSLN